MNFELSDEQELIRRTVREFAETKVSARRSGIESPVAFVPSVPVST